MVYTAGFNVEVLEGEDDLPLIRVVNVLVGDLICDHAALELGPALPHQTYSHGHQRVQVVGLQNQPHTGYCLAM